MCPALIITMTVVAIIKLNFNNNFSVGTKPGPAMAGRAILVAIAALT